MIRPSYFIIVALFVSALLLVGQAVLLRPAYQSTSGSAGPQSAPPVDAYLAAVDRLLATGDDQDLRRIVAPNFSNWNAGNGTPLDYTAFIGRLEELRSRFPGLKFQQTVLRVDGNIATVQLTASSTHDTSVSGMSLRPIDLTGSTEILRFAGGLLAERWGFAPLSGAITVYDSTAGLPAESVSLTRWTIAGEDRRDRPTGADALLLLVENGSVQIRIAQDGNVQGKRWTIGGEGSPIEAPVILGLNPGDALYLPPHAIVRIWLANGLPASLASIRLRTAVTYPLSSVDSPDFLPGASLGSSELFGFPAKPMQIELGFMHLDEGSTFRTTLDHLALVLVETGTIEAEALDRTTTTLHRGEVAISPSAAPASYRVTSASGADLYLIGFSPVR